MTELSPAVKGLVMKWSICGADADQQREADVQMKTLTVALSGAVAVVAHIDSNILHVASTGDCTAVIGTLSENDTWVPTKLTNEHNSDNKTEVQRICGEHPGENPKHIIKACRRLFRLFSKYLQLLSC